MKLIFVAAAFFCAAALAQNQTLDSGEDYGHAASVFPRIWKPYQSRFVPEPANVDRARLEIADGKLHLTLHKLIAAVISNNLAIASARIYPAIAQTDLLRARSGQSPRGVDMASIPSGVFSGAEGGSILGSAGGGGGGGSSAGGITGGASAVNVRPGGVFDPSISVGFSLDRTASPLNSLVVAGAARVTTATAALNLSYVQAFSSGTSISASYGLQRQGSSQDFLLFNPAFTPGFTATVTQQLLNGFGFKVNRALIEVAQNEQHIERESFRQQAVTALVSAENAYWDLIAAQEAVRAAELELQAAQQLAFNNRKSYDAGIMSMVDIETADSQVASSQRDLVVAKTAEELAEVTLKSMLTKDLDGPLASAVIEIDDTFPEPEDEHLPPLQEAMKIAKENRPEISIANGNIKSETDVIPFIKNSLLPNLNAFALFSTVALDNILGTALVEVIHVKYPQIAVGISVSFPVQNRQAEADEIRSRMEMRQAQDTLVRTKSQVEVDVQNGMIAVTQGKGQVSAAREASRLAVEKYDAEQKKLAVGLSTPYNVILAQRDVFTARVAEVQARDTYAKARVTLDQAMGATLEAGHVDLDDAIRGTVK